MIEWNDIYLIGDDGIDSQHKELFRIANVLLAAESDTDLKLGLAQLFKYVRYHFDHEEQIMRDIKYPEYEQHIGGHFMLLKKLNKVSFQLNHGTLDKQTVEKFVSNWAYGHIPVMDMRLSNYIKEHKLKVNP
jgi:hemerythrin